MKSSGSAERRDGGAYKALTALRKGISGSYVILFFPTLTDVCLSHFSDTVNECRAEIYLIEQHSHGLWPEAEKKKIMKKQLACWPFRQLELQHIFSVIYSNLEVKVCVWQTETKQPPDKRVWQIGGLHKLLVIPTSLPLLVVLLAISSCICSLQDQVKPLLCGKRRTS